MLTEYNALAHRGANSVCTWGLLHDKIINCLNLLAYIFVSLSFQDDSAESKLLSMSQIEGRKKKKYAHKLNVCWLCDLYINLNYELKMTIRNYLIEYRRLRQSRP